MDKYDNIKKPPAQYIEDFVEYRFGVDTMPNLLEMILIGLTYDEACRMERLYRIEAMKYHLRETVADEDSTEEEIAELQAYIEQLIEEYNRKMSAAEHTSVVSPAYFCCIIYKLIDYIIYFLIYYYLADSVLAPALIRY